VIPADTRLKQLKIVQGNTLAGTFKTTNRLLAQRIVFIELQPTMIINLPPSPVFNRAECLYDVILGHDCLHRASIEILFGNQCVSMMGVSISMRTQQQLRQLQDPRDLYLYQEDLIYDCLDECYEVKYKKSEYKAADVWLIVDQQCQHLEPSQRKDLYQVLCRFPDLFSGSLQKYTKEINIEVDLSVTPSFKWNYTIPHHNLKVFKAELDDMVGQDVIEHAEPNDWCSASFAVLKSNGTMRLVTDFCKLNVAVKRREYPMPLIPHMV
jgi:hypothetical protein